MCAHRVIRWLHAETEEGCAECASFSESEGSPCSAVVCVDCGESVEPTTDEHHRQLIVGA